MNPLNIRVCLLPYSISRRVLIVAVVVPLCITIALMIGLPTVQAAPHGQEGNIDPLTDAVNTGPADLYDADGWFRGFIDLDVDGSVYGVEVSDDDIYLWGAIRSIGGVPITTLAKYSGQTGTWENINMQPAPYIKDIHISGNRIVVAGQINVAGVNHGMAIWENGQWIPLGGAFDKDVNAFTWHQGELYATGTFTTIDGESINRIARWTGERWIPLRSGLTGTASFAEVGGYALVSTGEALYVGGAFTIAGGVSVSNLAVWQDNDWRNPASAEGIVSALAWDGTSLYVGTEYSWVNGSQQYGIVRIYNGQRYGLGGGLTGGSRVTSIVPVSGGLYVSGSSLFYSATTSSIAYFDGANWYALGAGLSRNETYQSPVVRSLALWQGKLVAVGDFDHSGGKSFRNVALWDGTQWGRIPLNLALPGGVNDVVEDMLVYGNDLYVVGKFNRAGLIDVPGIARWDGTQWNSVADGTRGGLDRVKHIAVNQNGIYLAGIRYTMSDFEWVWSVVHWNGSTWRQIGADMQGEVRRMVADQQAVYAMGYFGSHVDSNGKVVARWDGENWGFYSKDTFSQIADIAVIGQYLYLCGTYLTPDQISQSGIGFWNGTTWELIPGVTPGAGCALTTRQGELYLSGDLTELNTDGVYVTRHGVIRIVGKQGALVTDKPSGGPVLWSDRWDLYTFSFVSLPEQLSDGDGFYPVANIVLNPANTQQALPIPKTSFIKIREVLVYQDMLVIAWEYFIGGGRQFVPLQAWKPHTGDMTVSVSTPAMLRLGEPTVVTSTITLLSGTSAPYVIMRNTINRGTLQVSNAACTQGTNATQCAWRYMNEGATQSIAMSLQATTLDPVRLEVIGQFSGIDTDLSNDQAAIGANVYGVLPLSDPSWGWFSFPFNSGYSIDVRPGEGAGSGEIEVQATTSPPVSGKLTRIGSAFQLGTTELTFSKPIEVSVYYGSENILSAIETSLTLHRYNPESGEWVPSHLDCEDVPPGSVVPVDHRIYAQVCRTGTYALFAEQPEQIFLPDILGAQ